MALKHGKPNALNALELRRVSFPARQFFYTTLPRYSPSTHKQLDAWIYNNLNSRYYIGQAVDLVDNTLVFVTKIGFEEAKELSFFKLGCPVLG